jgi:glycosyltransferase involved in cell wall biosynthesis
MLQPNRLLRIALVTPILPLAHDRTRGRYIFETATALARRADVRVYFQLNRYPEAGPLGWRTLLRGAVDEPCAIDSLDVECFSYPSIQFATRLLNGLTSSRFLTPRVAEFAPDVVIGYWVYPDGFAALRAARSLRVPCVVGALGSDVHVRSGIASWLTGRVIRRADALVTVSEAMRTAAVRDFGADRARVHTIVNGFNTGVFRPGPMQAARLELGLPPDGRLIVYVGRLVPAKGLRELLTAFGRLAQQVPDCRLALVGDGPMQAELARLLSEAGLESRVILTGGLEPPAVAGWVRASDLLTLPSWSEGYPNVVVEALACGRPVVATDVGGTREIVDAFNGILVPPRNPAALLQALCDALAGSWDHAGIAARMKRTWDDVAEETLQVCKQVIEQAGVAVR